MLRPSPNRTALHSKSAPNLDKTRNALGRAPNDIGNTSSNDNNKSFWSIINKVAALSPLPDWIRSGNSTVNNSFLQNNNASLIPDTGLGPNSRSKSIGNIPEGDYDTVFSTGNFIIARGVSNSIDLGSRYVNIKDDDTDKLLEDSNTF